MSEATVFEFQFDDLVHLNLCAAAAWAWVLLYWSTTQPAFLAL